MVEGNGKKGKLMSPAEAVSLIGDGDTISISGWVKTRSPMVLIYEMIRQGKKDLTLATLVYGIELDMLVGAGLVKRIEVASGSINTSKEPWTFNVRRARIQGSIEYTDLSVLSQSLRLLAGAMGVPYMPSRTLLGSDLLRYAEADLVREIRCPFTGDPLALLRALRPDVALIHAQQADSDGNAIIYGPRADDDLKARAAKRVIITVDEIVDPQLIMRQPSQVAIPGYHVDAIVHVPYGAHPTASYYKYDFDLPFVEMYQEKAKAGPEGMQDFFEEYVYSVRDHYQYLEKVGGIKRLSQLDADALLGY